MASLNQQRPSTATTTTTATLTTSTKVDRFSHLNQFSLKPQYTDSGTLPPHHYNTYLSPIRSTVRSYLLPIILWETPIIYEIQQRLRCDWLDYYFSHTANLASHTFYVLFVPLPIWFGLTSLTRTLVFILGYGIYFTGAAKDWLCLPRPGSPPVSRITLSGYTAREYGFPSSHSANATAVSMLLALIIDENKEWFSNWWWYVVSLASVFIYWFSLIFGRIYCGMHGFSDIVTGSVIGLSVLFVCLHFQSAWDQLIMHGSIINVILSSIFNYALIIFHPLPIDDCPCYDDSVAFIGVIIGIEWASWWFVNVTGVSDSIIHYSHSELGFLKTILRVLVGVGLVVLWKEVLSKPVLKLLFKPFFKKRPSTSLNFAEILQLTNSQHQISHSPHEHDTEYISLIQDRHNKSELQNLFKCSIFKKHRSCDLEILIRLTVYGGISWCSIVSFNYFVELLGLGCINTNA